MGNNIFSIGILHMKTIVIIGAILGLTSIIMGAASDHFFSEFVTVDNAKRLDTALRYHQLYAILIFCVGLYGLKTQPHPTLKWASYAFCLGVVIFSGSLYASLLPSLSWIIFMTPLGGMTIMVGWLLCIINALLQRV